MFHFLKLISFLIKMIFFSAATVTSMCPGIGGTTQHQTLPPLPLPGEYINHMNISDSTRLAYNENGGTKCDDILFPVTTWVRFMGSSGTKLANCPIPIRHCAATSPGWYSGVYPSIVGDTTSGNVCFNWDTNTCMYTTPINVTNCNGFFVFALSAPPICDARFCTI